MSMRDYAFDDYGIVLKNEEVVNIANSLLFTDDVPFAPDDICGAGYYLEDSGIASSVSEFSGSAYPLNESGTDDYGADDAAKGDTVFYLPTPCYPSFFAGACKDREELNKELKEKYGKYLPDDFDYTGRFCHIVGTYWG